jgi:transposase-like protein
MIPEFKSIFDLLKAFPNEQSCIDHLERLRWNGEPVSPFEADSKVYKCAGNKYKCKKTGKYFNVRTNTIFDNTKIPLQKWFLALYVFSSHKKGISSHQLAKDITVTQKSAWFLLHRLRYAFDHPNFKDTVGNIVEIDECGIGGQSYYKHANKKLKNADGATISGKTSVLGMLERTEFEITERPHKVIAGKTVKEKTIIKPSTVKAVVIEERTKEVMLPVVYENVKPNSVIMTDELAAYQSLNADFEHHSVNHSAKQFVDGMAHSNGIESFWSHLKRGIDGIYHSISKGHLQSYVDEFSFRMNTRTFGTQQRFDFILAAVSDKKLTYNDLTK